MSSNFMKVAAPFFLILGLTFIALLILLNIAIQNNKDNDTRSSITMMNFEYDKWGEIPGYYGYQYNQTMKLFNIQGADSQDHLRQQSSLSLSSQPEIVSNVVRNFDQATYIDNQGSISYSESYNLYQQASSSQNKFGPQPQIKEDRILTETMNTHINMGGLSLWYQMINKPRFWFAFKALAQIRNQMINELEARYYAFHCYYYAFNDQQMILNSVLKGLPSPAKIYLDDNFGLDSSRKLYIWVQAFLQGTDSASYKAIVNYYNSINIPLSDNDMSQIIGKSSLIAMLVHTMEYNIIYEYGYIDNPDSSDLYIRQWNSLEFLTNEMITLHDNAPQVYSFADLTDINSIQVYPEFDYYKNVYQDAKHSPSPAVLNLTLTQAQALMNPNMDFITLLNPQNLFSFFDKYEKGDKLSIKDRFGLDSYDQVDQIYSYLNYLIDKQLNFENIQGSYEENVFSQIMLQAINQTYTYLENSVSFEVHSRYLAQYIQNNGYTCNQMVFDACQDQTQADQICAKYDFTKLTSIQYFMKPIFYITNTTYMKTFQTETGLNAAQTDILYNTAVATSFGGCYAAVQAVIGAYYKCAVQTACTMSELAQLQYGSAGVTKSVDPAYQGSIYLPISDTVYQSYKDTIAAPAAGLSTTEPPELYHYCNINTVGLGALNQSAINQIIDPLQGLMNQYQATIFTINVSHGLNITLYNGKFQVDDSELLLLALRYLVQDYFLGGFLTTATLNQWFTKFDIPQMELMKMGDFLEGTDYDLIDQAYPIYNTPNDPYIRDTQIRIDAGFSDILKMARVRFVNLQPTLNKNMYINNGTGPQSSLLQVNPWNNLIYLNNATNGMQYRKNDPNDYLTFYDNRMLRIVKLTDAGETIPGTYNDKFQYKVYKMQPEEQGKSPVSTLQLNKILKDGNAEEQYQASATGTMSMGPAYNLPVSQGIQGCNGCDSGMYSKINIDGQAYAANPNSQYKVVVEPNTGFMIQAIKQTSVFVQFLKSQNLAFPDLDKISSQLIPFYDLTEQISINEETFSNEFSFESQADKSSKGIKISFAIIGSFFIVLGLIFMVIHCKNMRKNSDDSDENNRNKAYDKY